MTELNQIHICDVCRLLDSDTSKKLCGYCGMCDAWICSEDQPKWGRRLLAAAKRKLEPGFAGQNDYVEKVQKELARSINVKPLINSDVKPSVSLGFQQVGKR